MELKNTSVDWQTHYDAESRTPFATFEDKVIVYDNEQSISEKIDFAIKMGLGGAMVWSVDTDDFHGDCSDGDENFVNFPLMRCINKAIHRSVMEQENEVRPNHHSASQSSATFLLPLSISLYLVLAIGFRLFE